MTYTIIDENLSARIALKSLADQIPELQIACECCNAMDAYHYLRKNKVDLLFMDIELQDMSGLELSKIINRDKMVIIFTTAKKEYAVEAFELNAADYLMKPINPARFIQAVNKAKIILQNTVSDVRQAEEDFLFIRDSTIVRRLSMDDILYAEALGDYVRFYTQKKLFAIHGTLKGAEARLPQSKFIRVHRSYIVAISKIDTLQDGGIVIGGNFLPVADAYRKMLNKRMNVF